MKLTDELRAQMVSALKQSFRRMTEAGWEPEITERECVIAAAAYRAGAEDMRERAAKVLDDAADNPDAEWPVTGFADRMVRLIRALGVDDE